jgi:DNA polymerase/3'-5' exonuclease PolX
MSIWSKIFGKGSSSSSKETSPSSESAELTTISGIGPGFAKKLKSSKEERAKNWIKLAKKA